MQKQSLWTKEFLLANCILFSLNMGYFILYSTIGIYTRGLTSVEFYVGLVTGIFTFASLCTRFFSGRAQANFTAGTIDIAAGQLRLSLCRQFAPFGLYAHIKRFRLRPI